jgi:hypothetical protein
MIIPVRNELVQIGEKGRIVLPGSKGVGGEGRGRGEKWPQQCTHI